MSSHKKMTHRKLAALADEIPGAYLDMVPKSIHGQNRSTYTIRGDWFTDHLNLTGHQALGFLSALQAAYPIIDQRQEEIKRLRDSLEQTTVMDGDLDRSEVEIIVAALVAGLGNAIPPSTDEEFDGVLQVIHLISKLEAL